MAPSGDSAAVLRDSGKDACFSRIDARFLLLFIFRWANRAANIKVAQKQHNIAHSPPKIAQWLRKSRKIPSVSRTNPAFRATPARNRALPRTALHCPRLHAPNRAKRQLIPLQHNPNHKFKHFQYPLKPEWLLDQSIQPF